MGPDAAAFDDRDELQVADTVVAEVGVDLASVIAVDAIDDDQGVEVDLVAFEGLHPLEHRVEGSPALGIEPVAVVECSWSVDGQTDEELMLPEERGPGVVEQDAVGLQGVDDLSSGGRKLLLQLDDVFEEFETEQRRFAPLPGERDFLGLGGLRRDVLTDIRFERFGRHPPRAVIGIQLFLVQVVAVLAIEVADRADRLGHDVHALLCERRSGRCRCGRN